VEKDGESSSTRRVYEERGGRSEEKKRGSRGSADEEKGEGSSYRNRRDSPDRRNEEKKSKSPRGDRRYTNGEGTSSDDGPKYNKNMRAIRLGELPRRITAAEISSILANAMGHTSLDDIIPPSKLQGDGEVGYAKIVFRYDKDVEKAVEMLHGYKYEGVALHVTRLFKKMI